MQTDRISLDYQITFNSAFHCGSGLAHGLIDRAVVRDKDRYLYIPGSTTKGVLREQCEYLARFYGLSVRDPHDEKVAVQSFTGEIDIVESIFGSRYREGSLFFDNAYMTDTSKAFFDGATSKRYLPMQLETRTQTRLSRRTGTVQEGALYTSEFCIAALEFTGKIHGVITGIQNELSELQMPGTYQLLLVLAGMSAIERIGANRSTGFGNCRITIMNFLLNDQPQNPRQYCEELDSLFCYDDSKEAQA